MMGRSGGPARPQRSSATTPLRGDTATARWREMRLAELCRMVAAEDGRAGPDDAATPVARAANRPAPAAPLPDGPALRRLRALWISAFHLGVVRERTDAALAAWLGRETGADAARATPAALARATRTLEAWLARAAGVDWRPHLSLGRNGRVRETRRPKARVLEAQWRLLHRRGLVRIGSVAALGAYAAKHAGLGRLDSHLALSETQSDALIRHFGKRLRAARDAAEERRAAAPEAPGRARERAVRRRRSRPAACGDAFASTSG